MATIPYDHTITEMLQTAAELIGLKPKAEQPLWVLFLLNELKSMTPQRQYTAILTAVQEEIARQLAEFES